MLLNLCLLITCTFLVSLTYRELPVAQRRAASYIRLGLAAVTAVTLVIYGVTVDEHSFHLSFVPIALIVLRYGPWKGCLVGLPAAVYLMISGGKSLPIAVLDLGSVVALSTLVRPRLNLAALNYRLLWLTPVPFLGLVFGVLLTPEGRSFGQGVYVGMLALHVLALLMCMGVIHARLALLFMQHELRQQIMQDDLTGLGNRRRFDQELAQLDMGGHLVLLDVDHFRSMNETYGTAAGDRALRYVAQMIRDAFPGRGFRLNGDSFALLLDLPDAPTRVEALLASFATSGNAPWSHLSLSAGLATRHAGHQPGDLLHTADEALFLAKTNGRNRMVVGQAPIRRSSGSTGTRPVVRPRYALWQAQRTTVGLLAQRRTLTDHDWHDLLRLAVSTVEGVEAGSLNIRDGTTFRMVATQGYPVGLVGLRFTDHAQLAWYRGSMQDWRRGIPRVLRGSDIQDAWHQGSSFGPPEGAQRVALLASRDLVQCTLCIPVRLGGEVVAHLNLESMSSPDTFTPQVISETESFAQQIAALLQLQQRWRELDLLAQLHAKVGADDGLAQQHLVEVAVDLMYASHVALLRYDSILDALVHCTSSGVTTTPRVHVVPRDDEPAWDALDTGQILRIDSIRDSVTVDVRAISEDHRAAQLIVPLISHERGPMGILIVFRSHHHAFQHAEEGLAGMLASIGVSILERGAHVADLRIMLDASLNTLGVALEARDFETQGHTERVRDLAGRMGQALGLAPERLTALAHGATLHDIGKLCIPDSVLLKPGRLSPEEFQVMQQHAPLGAELVARIPYLHPEAHAVVRHHHERWDGTGYPDRRAGEDIPLLARIFALCDVYDALTSERPYKKAMGHAQAMTILTEGRGTQFDPQLTDLFVQVVGDGVGSEAAPPLPAGTAHFHRVG